MLLDTRTALILICMGDITLFLLLVAIGRSLRFDGELGYFPYGRLLQGAGLMLFLLRGSFPGTASVFLCNGFFIIGLAMEVFCLTNIGKAPTEATRKRWTIATVAICAAFAFIYFTGASIMSRTLIYSMIVAGFNVTVAAALLSHNNGTPLRRVVGFFFLLVTAPMLAWGLRLFEDGPSTTLFENTSLTTMTMLVLFVHMMISSISYLMMHREIIAVKLEMAATRDFLTNACNRMQFLKLSSALMREAVAEQRPVSVLMIDLDRFKYINDTYGHTVGDQVLRYFSEQSVSIIRHTDVFGRYGGDEFVVFAPNTTATEIVTLGECLRAMTHQRLPGLPEFRVSIGTATIVPSTVDELEPLITMADRALLHAKERGRDQVAN